MRILAFNCSPKMEKGNTALILGPFLEGAREAGADVELLFTKRLKINPCQGELNCYVKTPGVCFQKDDMQTLLPKLREADIWLFATPVYWDGVAGPMKDVMDRITPLSGPFYEVRDGHCTVALGEGAKPGSLALISTAGCWEMDNFDPLLVHMRAFCRTASRRFAGALLRPHADVLSSVMAAGGLSDVLAAAREAGRGLVRDGEVSPRLANIVGRELMPLEEYIGLVNAEVRRALEARSEG